MPISPFLARLAIFGFVAIGGGIAINVLSMQQASEVSQGPRSGGEKTRFTLDAERLRRLALDAISAGEASSRPAAPTLINVREQPSTSQRVGSFSPSSGKLLEAALPGATPGEARKATITAVQAELGQRGYEPGPADGVVGLVTRAAVLAYEHDQGLPLTADPTAEVLAHLRYGSSAPGIAVGLDGEKPVAQVGHADAVIRAVQQSLRQLGYLSGAIDGQVNDDTVRAIREFEMDAGLVPTGRISAPLVSRLGRQLSGRARS